MLPKNVINSIRQGLTSLGNHPAFPPDDEEKFIVRMADKEYQRLCKACHYENAEEARNDLNRLISDAMKKEKPVKEALTSLCKKTIYDMFDIPEDTVDITVELVQHVDVSDVRKLPEPTEGFSFEDIDEMEKVTEMIYQRRFMDALICGASVSCAAAMKLHIGDVFDLDPELPALYKKITDINTWLLYTSVKSDGGDTSGGRVDVYPGNDSTKSIIKAKGILFPMLLSEAVKGILELAVSKGLPDNKDIREYIVKKADFRLAELWDTRLGIPLWKRIEEEVEESGSDMSEIGMNFLFMEMACMEPGQFNDFMRNVLAGTKKGKSEIAKLTRDILKVKEEDDFDDFIRQSNDQYDLNDGNFNPGEILSELEKN